MTWREFCTVPTCHLITKRWTVILFIEERDSLNSFFYRNQFLQSQEWSVSKSRNRPEKCSFFFSLIYHDIYEVETYTKVKRRLGSIRLFPLYFIFDTTSPNTLTPRQSWKTKKKVSKSYNKFYIGKVHTQTYKL